MDLASLIGLVVCFGICIFGMVWGQEDPVGMLKGFVDIPSLFITLGGAFCCMLMQAKDFKSYVSSITSFGLILKPVQSNEAETIQNIISLSNVARKEGLLALEEAANSIEDPFLKKGILLIVDGTDPELVRSILETELNCIESRHSDVIGFWSGLGAMGPAWGMIGTLIGLVNMLKKLDDLASVGPNMAVALITTFYGSVLANWICEPVSGKLKMQNASEIMVKEVLVEGLLSIQAGENPRVIEEKLKSFLAPNARAEIGEGNDEGGER